MKPIANTLSSLILVFLLQPFVHAQDVAEEVRGMNLGANNAVILTLPQYKQKMAEGVWKDYLKEFDGKTRRVKKSKESFTDDASIPFISSNTVDLYSIVESNGAGSRVVLWTDLGGSFLNSDDHQEAYEGMMVFLEGYQKELNVEQIGLELKMEEDELKDMEKNLSKLQRQNEKFHREIEDWKQKIAENEDLIQTNVKDQDDMQGAIEDQKGEIRDVEVKLAKAKN